MSLFTFFSGSGSNAFKNQVKAINNNAALSDTEKMAAISLLIYPYNPLIRYDWSTTTTSGLRYLRDIGSTPTYNANMYFGRGAYLNGVDQTITVPINKTIQTALRRVNGVITINETSQVLTNYVISGLGVHKDYYLFTRLLTTDEKDSYTNTPELFYAMAQADIACVLNMPMCETSSIVRNYKTGIDYSITNYTSNVRDNAKNLRYGLQTCKFVRNSLGVIQGASNYLECDGVGYSQIEWYPTIAETFTIEMILELTENSDFQLHGSTYSGGIFIGQNTGNKRIYIRLFNSQIHTAETALKPYVCITYSSETKLISIYTNGVFSGTLIASDSVTSNPFLLGRTYPSGYPVTKPLRLFKVHNKVLTQAEITENYNNYVAKGLLS